MSDEMEMLEGELKGMRPRKVAEAVAARIAGPLSEKKGWRSDRWLMCAVGSGLVAACVIAGVLVADPVGKSSGPVEMAREKVPRMGDLSVGAVRAELASLWK